MANDIEAKRLADWKVASKKYCDLLEETVEELRSKSENCSRYTHSHSPR